MSPTVALITGFVLALIAAAGWVGWIWKVRLARLCAAEGLAILSGMRWRELSNLVTEALASSGFERETGEQQAARGTAGEVHIYRDGRPWILICRQGVSHVVTRAAVEDFARSLRNVNAAGGVLVTPGRVEPDARTVAPNIELLDGDELWKLVGPLLPGSVHGEVTDRARARALRASGAALSICVVAGLALGFALSRVVSSDDDVQAAPIAAAKPSRAAAHPAATTTATSVAPMSEDEERESIVHEISVLPGVDKALWSTRSTLQVFLNDPNVADDTALCSVMKRYELLRASRLQIQSPAGSARPVRFMQCAVY
ncbi:restriction endonuclease [Cognatilysobacter terrigena]|uniref:restriction endonuclease n=1 Tax=Cognatilysobacter terrigena TaxID=2488749 RepID=UPI00105C91C2|nr:restriction endonuclease [Lysobacter terrigena]